ncbi:pantoate--beta-alanine ligase [Sphingomonas naphthae]|uniref:Pantothenate synthetase n=1 Tax=Sphingomonas naphthae TaxID=1813468 RepID=A0ABY7TIB9_9SPHN|nr:pantoate--beta-alanine ligase [Sphingomonas naphthae]WCT72551.1 pantoate--beta-alanine ligase [Sphingomonas naphthae]
MEVLSTIADFRAARAKLGTLGLVPTMGALHEGHLGLVRAAKARCAAVAATIFVNPLQFGPNEDFSRYPRTLPNDLKLLEAEGVDLVFTPTVDVLYPAGFASRIEVGPIADRLEGAVRPGHFAGVATVVAKLFAITRPDVAFFGQKDVQQTVVIRRMVADLDVDVAISVEPTAREADGLARSSRNIYLDAGQRAQAPALYRALMAADSAWASGERNGDVLRDMMREIVEAQTDGVIDYVSFADPVALEEIDRAGHAGGVLSLAVRFGTTRLLDNHILS